MDQWSAGFYVIDLDLLVADFIDLAAGEAAHVPVTGRRTLGVELGIGEEVGFHANRRARQHRQHRVELVVLEPHGQHRIGKTGRIELDLEPQFAPLLGDVVAAFEIVLVLCRRPGQEVDLWNRLCLGPDCAHESGQQSSEQCCLKGKSFGVSQLVSPAQDWAVLIHNFARTKRYSRSAGGRW